jgi:hypothetical protein
LVHDRSWVTTDVRRVSDGMASPSRESFPPH